MTSRNLEASLNTDKGFLVFKGPLSYEMIGIGDELIISDTCRKGLLGTVYTLTYFIAQVSGSEAVCTST